MRKLKMEVPIGVTKRLQRVLFEEIPKLDERTPKEVVALIYKTVDYYYQKVVAKEAYCKRGCSWCCRVPVTVTAVEMQYIHDTLGIDAHHLKKGEEKELEPDGTPCPFLKNGECSIYDSRPFNCRVFASMDDPSNCIDPSNQHLVVSWESNNGLKLMREYLDYCSAQYPDTAAFADIRHWYGQREIPIKIIK